jgi:hypothetical protein
MNKHELLLELIQLREKDYDKFLDKLYDAITTEFHDVFVKELLKEKEYQSTLDNMILHFEKKEEYEKCEVLLKLIK